MAFYLRSRRGQTSVPGEGQKKEVPSVRAPVLRGAAPWRACPLAVHPGPRAGTKHPSKARPPLPVLPLLPSSPFWSIGQSPAPAFWHPQKLKLARSVLPRGQHANYSSQAAASLPRTQVRSYRPRGLLLRGSRPTAAWSSRDGRATQAHSQSGRGSPSPPRRGRTLGRAGAGSGVWGCLGPGLACSPRWVWVGVEESVRER